MTALIQKLKAFIRKLYRVDGVESAEEQKRMYRQSMSIAAPALVEGALMSVISSVDTMMVGSLGSVAIAAVGLTGQPRMVLLLLAQALCVGTMALVARRKGAGDDQGARNVLSQSMVIITLIGLVISFVGIRYARPLLMLVGANEETIHLSSAYFTIISYGFLPNCWQLCINSAFRALGRTKITLLTNLISNIVNVFFNYLLIGGNLGFPPLGVEGAAIATTIGTTLAGFIALAFVMRKDDYFAYNPFKFPKFSKDTLKGLANIGLGIASESVFLRLGFIFLQKIIAGIGTAAFAAYQIVSQVTSLSFTVGDAIGTAVVSLVGQSLGAKKPKKAQQYVALNRKIGITASILLIIVVASASNLLPRLFTNEADVIKSAQLSFLVVVFGMIPQNGRVIYAGCLRGAGDVKYVAMCSLLGVGILRPALTYLFCYPLHSLLPFLYFADIGPWISYVIDAFVRNFLLARRVNKGDWVNIRL